MGRFDGAVVVLTGVGSQGQVGEALAHAFADEGAVLALIGHSLDVVAARAAEVVASGGRATPYACDLTDPKQVAAVAGRVAAETAGRTGPVDRPAGRIDALVNVAGGFALSGPMGAGDVGTLESQLAVNLTTAWVASNAFIPIVRDGGSVVYFASASALPYAHSAGMSAYVAAKAGVIGLMQSVAAEGRARRVRANAVAPTTIRTGANLQTMGQTTAAIEREAVADAVLFLCSTAARAITGQVIRLAD
jgi:NAD(P)-dependent dehydrogenase (short-subunit alcohol dehydrogenase family)